MAFVIDASAALPWFLEDERTSFTEAVLAALGRNEYWVPAIWALELVNGLLMAERRRRIDHARRLEALDQAVRLPIRVDPTPPDIKALSNLAERRGLSAYDASYLELALRQGFGLITLDRGLAEAAAAEGIVVQAPGRGAIAQRRRRYNI
jgi:predicted nucleic acid-binding protein